MKNALFILLCAVIVKIDTVKAQAGLFLDGGVKLVCSNAPYLVIENGKWKNTSSTFTSDNSTVKFTGNALLNINIEGANTSFHNIQVDKTGSTLGLVSTNTTVKGNLIFSNGLLNLSNKTITLTSVADMSGEMEASRTYGALPGKISKTRSLNNPAAFHFGNMGIHFTVAGNLGSTTVERVHPAQALPSGGSIKKYWNVTAANPSGWSATLRFQYFDAELNGLNEADLNIWRSTDNGVTWVDMGRSSNSTTSNYVELTAIADVSGRWTLGAPSPLNGPSEERAVQTAPPVSEDFWRIYPNPANQWITVSFSSSEEKAMMFELLSVNGNIALKSQRQVLKGENSFLIDIGNLTPGVYFARVAGQPFQPIRLIKTISGRP